MSIRFLFRSMLGILLLFLAVIMSSSSCSEAPLEPSAQIPDLAEVREVYSGGSVRSFVANGINVEIFEKAGKPGSTICFWLNPDSCFVVGVEGDGEVVALVKPAKGMWACIARNIELCRNFHPDLDDPEDQAEYADCVAFGWTSCAIAYTVFAWFCE